MDELKRLCENCGGRGWTVGVEYHYTTVCCGNYLRTGECCGEAVPGDPEPEQVQVRCEPCDGTGQLPVAA